MGVYQISSLFIYLLAPDISGFFRELLDGFDFYVCWINITLFSDLFLKICSFDHFYCKKHSCSPVNKCFHEKNRDPKKNPQIFPNFYSIGRSLFVCLFLPFQDLEIFFKALKTYPEKAFYLTKP